jgi:DNA invertase Pin-like site-specific DNA recombinase
MTSTLNRPARAVIYARLSLEKGKGTADEGAAVERQLADCVRIANERGYEIVATFADNDRSASDLTKPRPQYQAALRRLTRGDVTVVMAWAHDRLIRTTREYVDLEDLCIAQDIRIHLAKGGEFDLRDSAQAFFSLISAGMSSTEVRRKSERQRAANTQRREKGRAFPGGRRAFGFQPRMAGLVADEAALIRAAYEHIRSGGTIAHIVKTWNDRGVLSSHGKPFTPPGVRKTLLHPRNIGMVTYCGEAVQRGDWEPIVDEDLFNDVRVALAAPERARCTRLNKARAHLLGGILRCGPCAAKGIDSRMQIAYAGYGSSAGRPKYRQYRCKLESHNMRGADPLEELVQEAVWERLSRPSAVKLLLRGGGEGTLHLRKQLDVLRTRRDNVLELVARGLYSLDQATEKAQSLDMEMQAIQAELYGAEDAAVLMPLITSAEDAGKAMEGRAIAVERAWGRMDLAQRRAVIDKLLRITVQRGTKGRGFDPATVEIERLH